MNIHTLHTMDKDPKSSSGGTSKKRKRIAKVSASENIRRSPSPKVRSVEVTLQPAGKPSAKRSLPANPEELKSRYPVLNDEQMIKRFLSVPMTNNQKGRIRQLLRENLKGTSNMLLPDVIHTKIQTILRASQNLTDTELRKLRILYNMLKTSLLSKNEPETAKKDPGAPKKKRIKKNKVDGDGKEVKDAEKKEKTEKKDVVQKVKQPKRYVVFLGNLPLDINKEKILGHFQEMKEMITDVRIPKRSGDRKSAIAYVELANEPSYELALSKHHSMLDKRRINVLYSAQKNSKVPKAVAKSKAAKMVALQRAGRLLGSVPLHKKRSQRRLKMKNAKLNTIDND